MLHTCLIHNVDIRLQCICQVHAYYNSVCYSYYTRRPIVEEDDDNISGDSIEEDDLENDGANFHDDQL